MVNTSFKVMDSSSVLDKFAMDAEVLDIGNRDVILGLSWLTENGFSVDTQDRCLRNVNSGQVIPCSVRWIPEVLIMEEEPLEDGEILLIIDARKQYSHYAQWFPPNRQPDSLNTSPRITRSTSKTQRQRYPQGPSTRPPGRKTKPSESTCKRIS